VRRVYLDQKDWINLSRAHYGRADGERYVEALRAAERAVADGRIEIPLSSTNYMETSLGPDSDRRVRLAAVMERVSKFRTIADQQTVVPYELELALARAFAKPEPEPIKLFGTGAEHAFREPTYAGLDRIILAAPISGAAARAAHRAVDERFTKAREDQKQMFRERGLGSGQRLRDAAVGRTIADIIDPLGDALARSELTFDDFFDRFGDDLESFLVELPSRRVICELQRAQDAGASALGPGDLRDLGALAVAVAYCDVVFTERRWVDIVRKAKLDDAMDTIVSSDLAELVRILAETS
jgi:hypothetical protein